MVSSVRSRPNHYEMLGLKPAASEEEICRAFVGKMSVFGAHSTAETAQILVAYETLRDLSKRREYDRSIGLAPPSEPREWSFAVTAPRWTPFVAAASPRPFVQQSANTEARPSEPHVTPEAKAQLRPNAIAGEPEVRNAGQAERTTKPQSQRRERAELDVDVDTLLQHIRSTGLKEKEKLRSSQKPLADWKRLGLGLGGLVFGAGLIGGIAGLSVKDNVSPVQADPAPSPSDVLVRPHDEPAAGSLAERTAKTPETRIEPVSLPKISRSRRSPQRQQPSAWADKLAEDLPIVSIPPEHPPIESAAAEPGDGGKAQAIAATLPLSNSLVARTIERIGYPCGEIASTAPAEGEAPGVFKITCSSGQTYQARPVRGRYHFKRLGAR